jgi:uncharacterized protein YdhG (YjbR/CyaY superfamily)
MIPETVDSYITHYSGKQRAILEKTRATIRKNAPDASERISYRMPTFWQGQNLIHFALMKDHLGIYPTSSGVEAFKDKLKGYNTSKGAIQFPLDKPIDYKLIGDITRFRVHEVLRNGTASK